jgi:F0F1-type ATP synthase membrane subunit c/vacuolar-type H+-ATPase subunit K
MIKTAIKTISVCTLVLNLLNISVFAKEIIAQNDSEGYAITVPITEEVEEGDIICTSDVGFIKCSQDYQTSVYGVVVANPAVAITDSDIENAALILTSGIATVKVNASGGEIKEGNLVTTSTFPGVGKLAERNGYVLGSALDGYTNENLENIGKIQISLNIHPASGLRGRGNNLVQFIRDGIAVPIFDPLDSLRYILAVIMVIVSFTLGMVYFGRSSRAGIEAVGRNPLAQKMIQLTVFMNIVLTIVIVLVGLSIAYLILIL